LIVSEIELELLEPGLLTAKVAVPALPKSDAGMATVKCDESTNVVVRSEPFQVKTAPGTKLEPVIVKLRLSNRD